MNRRHLLHLLGAAVALPFVPPEAEAALAFGRAAHGASRGAGFRALSPARAELVTALADLILPRTDTPSASDVGVPAFIDHMLAEWYAPEDTRLTLAGLDEIDRFAGGDFLALDEVRQMAVATELDRFGGGDRGTAAWAWGRIKSLTVYGYFTSERVMTEVTMDPIVPGRFAGCVVVES
ncbi:MAG: gluconate 2-dehydrogenase subunit 3 family protein [Gemmatimonadota bacterium]|nr:gluconate 2-dehydrogenase subunit 3 family protein [Gemmatimonadota bacterium]